HTRCLSDWSSDVCSSDLPALLGIAMAAHVAVDTFASGVKPPEKVLGLSWNQVHLVLGLQATIMMLAFLVQSTTPLDKGIGLFLRSEERRVGKGRRFGGRQ